MATDRRAGILLHPTSLPGEHGIGSLGREAFNWLDFLADAGQTSWQVMPLGPTGYGDSPYQALSSFAGNHYLISLDELVKEGWLQAGELEGLTALSRQSVDYGALIPAKTKLLELAASRFEDRAPSAVREERAEFTRRHAEWLDDYTLFMALKESQGGGSWGGWPAELRDRRAAALTRARAELAPGIAKHETWQFWFFKQWLDLRAYAHERNIEIIGDVPIFTAYDSADCWADRGLFHLGESGEPTVVAGVPPDYFSATGQRWGNPLYRWDALAADDYRWWVERVRAALTLVDLVRIDHFRGFAAYWEIPADQPTAEHGRWVRGPGQEFFTALTAALGELPLIAEDLGVITPDVDSLRVENGLPGMRVLQFAFAGDANDPYLPHNYSRDTVVYTGTHDNDTSVGWYAKASEKERDHLRRYLACDDSDMPWALLRAALASVADRAIVPLQDALALGSEARMNVPGTASGNWSWRFAWDEVPHWLAPQLRDLAELYGRTAGALTGDAATAGSAAGDTQYRQTVLSSDVADG